MRKRVALVFWWAAALAGLAAAEGPYVEKVITPHWNWEGRHTGGTVRALFVVNEHALRQVDELAQRFDLEAEAVAIRGNTPLDIKFDGERWARLATQRWDVIVLASKTAWAALGSTNQAALEESLRQGARVALFAGQYGTNASLDALLAVRGSNRTAEVWRTLPPGRLAFRMPFSFSEYSIGAGRLFSVAHYDTHGTRFNAFMGLGMGGVHALAWYDEPVTPELFYAVADRWIRMAAGREGEPVVERVEAPAGPVSPGSPVRVAFRTTPAAAAGDRLEWVLHSPFGDSLETGTNRVGDPAAAVVAVNPAQNGSLALWWAWRRGAVTLDWGAIPLAVSNGAGFAAVTLPVNLEPGKPVDAAWTLNPGADEAVASLRVYDPDGALVALAEGLASRGTLQVPAWPARATGYELHLLLHRAGLVLEERRIRAVMAQDRAGDRIPYHVIAWATELGEYTDLARLERLRELGVTALAPIGPNTNLARLAASRGLRLVPTNILIPPGRNKKRFNKAEEAVRLESIAAGMAAMTPLGYSLVDEPGGVDPVPFRNFGAEVIRRRDPGARVGFCGVWEGYNRDVPAFLGACDFAEPYSPFHLYTPNLWMGCERDLYRAFMRPDAIVTCWTHYAPWLDHEPYSRTVPWLWLFEGLRGVSYFDTGGEFAVLPGDGRATHETRWWSEEIREIRSGIGEQLLAAGRDDGAVRILFHPNAAGAAAWARAFNELRVPWRFISHAELERGIEPGVRLLVCPDVPILTDPELGRIRTFVEAGGTLTVTAPFARYWPRAASPDAAPVPEAAPRDELDGILAGAAKPPMKEADPIDPWIRLISKPPNPVPEPAAVDRLEALCGIRYDSATGAVPMASLSVARKAPEANGVPVAIAWSADGPFSGTMTGATLGIHGFVPAAGGRLLASLRETAEATNFTPAEAAAARALPGVVEAAAGKGRSFFLGAQPDVPSLRGWIPALLAAAGVPEPGSTVALSRGSNDTVYAFRFRDGPIRFVGVVQDYWKVGPAWTVEGGRETALYFNHGASIWSENDATLNLTEPAHLYDVRRGRYLGEGRAAAFPLQPGRPELFACLPYKVTGLLLDAPAGANPGDGIEVGLRLEAGSQELGRHVVHVELADPSGRVREADRLNVHLQNGVGRLRIPLAWNAAAGEWTLTARDAVTGVSARSRMRVAPAAPLFRPWVRSAVRVERTPVKWPEGVKKPQP